MGLEKTFVTKFTNPNKQKLHSLLSLIFVVEHWLLRLAAPLLLQAINRLDGLLLTTSKVSLLALDGTRYRQSCAPITSWCHLLHRHGFPFASAFTISKMVCLGLGGLLEERRLVQTLSVRVSIILRLHVHDIGTFLTTCDLSWAMTSPIFLVLFRVVRITFRDIFVFLRWLWGAKWFGLPTVL